MKYKGQTPGEKCTEKGGGEVTKEDEKNVEEERGMEEEGVRGM